MDETGRAAQDTSRGGFPGLHPRPPRGWVNDPNGPIRWGGRHHLFFQHNPDAPVHGDICWGHLSSADLVRWRPEPVALRPTPGGSDALGCWSGCVVDDHGVATAVYTAVDGAPASATVCLARATDDDLRHWVKVPDPVAGPPPGLDLLGMRDPFVLTVDGSRFAVVGSGRASSGGGLLLLYGCHDLTDWTFLGVLVDESDPVAADVAPADFWECPQLFEQDGRWVLVLSLVVEPHPGRVVHLIGDLVAEGAGLRFVADSGGLVDHGHDFYAPAVLPTPDRTLLWGWAWDDRADDEPQRQDWAGTLTITREVLLGPGGRSLHLRPVPEMGLLHAANHDVTLAGPTDGVVLPAGPLDLAIEVTGAAGGLVRLDLGEMVSLELDLAEGRVELHRQVRAPSRRDWPTDGELTSRGDTCRVRILLDGSMVEVFVEDGPCFTERVAPVSRPRLALRGESAARCLVRVRQLA